jgi:hypothetical protein
MMDQKILASIALMRGYSTRPKGFPIIKTITQSEFNRGYLYVSNGHFIISHFHANSFDVCFMGKLFRSKAIVRGRVIIGREAMRTLARPQMIIRIEPFDAECLSIIEEKA